MCSRILNTLEQAGVFSPAVTMACGQAIIAPVTLSEMNMQSPFSIFAPMANATREIEAEAQARREARLRPQQQPQTGMDALKAIAIETGIPRNVLVAVIDAAGAETPEQALEVARNAGNRLSQRVRGGMSLREALNDATGDEAVADAIARRAVQIADQLDPAGDVENRNRPESYNVLRDFPAQVIGSALQMTGQAGAALADAAQRRVVNPIARGLGFTDEQAEAATPFIPGVGQAIGAARGLDMVAGGAGRALDRNLVSREAKDRQGRSTIEGSIFSPSTWKLSDEASITGFVQHGADVLGSLLPVIAAGVFTGGTGAAAMGGAMGFGGAAQDTGALIDEMAATVTKGGSSTRLRDESRVYREAVEGGMSHAQALEMTKARAQDIAGAMAAAPAAVGGLLTQRIMGGAANLAAQSPNRAIRAGGAALTSGAEEAAQEVAEGMAARQGANIGAGMDQSLTEGTAMEAAMGFGAGAVAGGVAGAFSRGPRERQIDMMGEVMAQNAAAQGQIGADPAPLGLPAPRLAIADTKALPAPPRALPPPDAPTGAMGAQTPGIAGPQAPAGLLPPPAGRSIAMPNEASGPTIALPPPRAENDPRPTRVTGPLSEAAQAAPGPVMPPEVQPGATLSVVIPGAPQPIDAQFIREEPAGVVMLDEVRGDEFTIPRSEIESGAVQIGPRTAGAPQEITPEAGNQPAQPPMGGIASPEVPPIPGPEPTAQGNLPDPAPQGAPTGITGAGQTQPGADEIMSRDDAPPGVFSRNEVLTTGTGRKTAPFPEIRLGSPAKARNTNDRIKKWWITEALAEMEAKGMDMGGFAARSLQGALDTGNITPSDLDVAADVLGQMSRGTPPARKTKAEKDEEARRREEIERKEAQAAAKAKREQAEADAKAKADLEEMEARRPSPEEQAAIDAALANIDVDGEVEGEGIEPEKPIKMALSVDFGGAKVSDRAQSLADRIMDVTLDAVRVQITEGDVGKSLSMVSALMDARNMLAAEIGTDMLENVVDPQINAAADAEAARLRAGKRGGSAQIEGGKGGAEPAVSPGEMLGAITRAKNKALMARDLPNIAKFTAAEGKTFPDESVYQDALAYLGEKRPGAQPEKPRVQGESTLPGGVGEGEQAAEDQGAAKDIIRRARVRALALKDDEAKARFTLDMRKPVSSALEQAARDYIKATQERANAAAEAAGVTDAGSKDDQKGQPAANAGEIPIPPGALSGSDQETAPTGRALPAEVREGDAPLFTKGQRVTVNFPEGPRKGDQPGEVAAYVVRDGTAFVTVNLDEGGTVYGITTDRIKPEAPAGVAEVADVATSQEPEPEDMGVRWNRLRGPAKRVIAQDAGFTAEGIENIVATDWRDMAPEQQRMIADAIRRQDEAVAKGKIEDFGSGKITGSRKDARKNMLDWMKSSSLTEYSIAAKGLNDTWPEPDWESMIVEGVDPGVVRAVAILRNTVGRKPNDNWAVEKWARRVLGNIRVAEQLLKGELQPDDLWTDRQERYSSDWGKGTLWQLMADINPGAIGDFSRIKLSYTTKFDYSQDRKGVGKDAITVQMPWEIKKNSYWSGKSFFMGEGVEAEIIVYVTRQWQAKRESDEAKRKDASGKPVLTLEVGSRNAQDENGRTVTVYVIAFDRGKGLVEVHGEFATKDEAQDYLDANRADLQEQAEDMILRPGAEWKDVIEPRSGGPEWRTGDVTPDMFERAFDLKGTEFRAQFGNWNNAKDRQSRLNDTFDALMDLAAVLGLPPKSLFFGGKLKFSFGARGRPGAAAHYEREQKVINLTRMGGKGTLSHEWFHALDNYLMNVVAEHVHEKGLQTARTMDYPSRGRPAGRGQRPYSDLKDGQYITATDMVPYTFTVSGRWPEESRLYARILEAGEALRKAVRKSGNAWFTRSKEIDKSKGGDPYWTETIELAARLFERTIYDRLTERGISNDFLVGISLGGGAYPTAREMNVIGADKAMADLLAALRELAELRGESGETFTKELPPINPDYAYAGPKVGQTWEGPNGMIRRIVEQVEGSPGMFRVDMGDGDEKPTRMSRENVEAQIDADAQFNDPAYKAKMEARKEAAAAAKKRREEREAKEAEDAAERRAYVEGLIEQMPEGSELRSMLGNIVKAMDGSDYSLRMMGYSSHAAHGAVQMSRDGYTIRPGRTKASMRVAKKDGYSWSRGRGDSTFGPRFVNYMNTLRDAQQIVNEKSGAIGKVRDGIAAEWWADEDSAGAAAGLISTALDGKKAADFTGRWQDAIPQGLAAMVAVVDDQLAAFDLGEKMSPQGAALVNSLFNAPEGDEEGGGTEIEDGEGEIEGGATEIAPENSFDPDALLDEAEAALAADGNSAGFDPDALLAQAEAALAAEKAQSQPAAPPRDGKLSDAWALFDDNDRKEAMRVSGIKDGVISRHFSKEWDELPEAIRTTMEAEWAKAPSDVRADLAGQPGQAGQGGTSPGVSRPRTAGEAGASAVKNVVEGLDDLTKAFNEFFGGRNKLSAGLTFTPESYERSKPLFRQAVRKFAQAGSDIAEMAMALVRGLDAMAIDAEARESMKPFTRQYLIDIHSGAERPFDDAQEAQGDDGSAGEGGDDGGAGPGDQLETGEDQGDGGGEAADGDGGNSGDGSNGAEPGDGLVGGGPGVSQALSGENPGNYVLTDADMIGTGTDSVRIAQNLEAIRIVKALEAENRYATREEQAKLVKFVGWGGLRQVFDPRNTGQSNQYGRAQAALREMLTKAEYNDAFNSTTDAHYTAPGVVRAMWQGMSHFGFKTGRALEPTMGSGNFLGFQPEDMASGTEWYGVEMDSLTSRIAAAIYPDAKVFKATPFQMAPLAQGVFDIAIGNPPFGSKTIDRGRDADLAGLKVHNYIIAKTGKHLRPGGIMAMVITHRFLDTANDEARSRLAQDFRFMGAIRLPNNAFAENARTEVTTDIVFFQKLKPGEKPDLEAAWLDTDGKLDGDIRVNRYFAENPQNILGRSAMDGTMYGGRGEQDGERKPEYTVHPDGRDLNAAITEIFETGTLAAFKDALGDREQALEAAVMQGLEANVADGGLLLTPEGKVLVRDGANMVEMAPETVWHDEGPQREGVLAAIEQIKALMDAYNKSKDDADRVALVDAFEALPKGAFSHLYNKRTGELLKADEKRAPFVAFLNAGVPKVWGKVQREALNRARANVDAARIGKSGLDRLTELMKLRKATTQLVGMEMADADPAEIERQRGDLKAQYEAFVAKNGPVNDPPNRAILRGDVGIEAGLEESYSKGQKRGGAGGTAKQASILSERVFFPHKRAETAASPEDGLVISMTERGKVDIGFIASLTGLTAAEVVDALTSGDSPRIFYDPEMGAYEDSEAYLSGNVKHKLRQAEAEGLEANIKALRAAQPAPKTKEQITPNPRAMWIPPEIFEGFLRSLGAQASVTIIENAGRISISGDVGQLTDLGSQFANDHRDVIDLFRSVVTGKPIVIFEPRRRDEPQRINEQATKEVNALAERMAKEFEKWAYLSAERVEIIVNAYNEKMNTHTERKHDGVRYLRPVGLGAELQMGGSKPLRNSQKNGAWRIVQSVAVLLHHVVGAGKTFTAIVGVMERKRMGLTKKPLIVVPNHLVEQWAADFRVAYPGARVLAAGKDDFTDINRRRMFARIATGDWDAIIIGESQLTKIENHPGDVEAIIEEQIEMLREALEEARASRADNKTVNGIAQSISKYEEKLQKIRDALAERSDTMGMTFRETGIDYLVVDEAHGFKNLEYQTAGERLVGMNPPRGSQKAFDLYVKTRMLLDQNERNGNKGNGIAFLTGTPVSNSLVEIYAMMKYLAPSEMKQRGVMHYDAWAGSYTSPETRFEYTATQKLVSRRTLSRMVNLSSLAQLYRQFADIILRDQLYEIYAEQIREENKWLAEQGLPLKDERFPVPNVAGGGRQLDTAKATPEQILYTEFLAARMVGMQGVRDKRAYASIDNALWVLSDARAAAIDIRAKDDEITERHPDSKIARAANRIHAIWQRSGNVSGTQLVFSDLSTPKKGANKAAKTTMFDMMAMIEAAKPKSQRRSEKALKAAAAEIVDGPPDLVPQEWAKLLDRATELVADPETDDRLRDKINEWMDENAVDAAATMATVAGGFSAYDDLKEALIEKGIPENEIAFIHDYDGDQAKADLFAAVRAGRIRVLMGSTPKMGAGTNVQDRIVALHHIDSPWRPADVEQREGRAIRAGNKLYEADPEGFQIEIWAYSTEGTSDVVLWQVLERKARGIEQFTGGALDVLEEEGDDSQSYAEFMAQSTGNPVFLRKLEAERDLLAAEAETMGLQATKEDAVSFLRVKDERIAYERGLSEIADVVPFKNVSFVMGFKTIKADADDLAPAMEAYRAEYNQALADHEAALAEWRRNDEERKRIRREQREAAQAAPRRKKGDPAPEPVAEEPAPPKPEFDTEKWPRPSVFAPQVQAASSYARGMKAMIDHLKEGRYNSEAKILSEAPRRYALEVTRQVYQADPRKSDYTVKPTFTAKDGGSPIRDYMFAGGGARVIDPMESGYLIERLMPGTIRANINRIRESALGGIQRLEEKAALAEKNAKITVDTSKVDEARARERYYQAAVRVAEAQRTFDNLDRPTNPYIIKDSEKRAREGKEQRSYGVDGDTLELVQVDFRVSGKGDLDGTYRGIGFGAIAPGEMGIGTFFEAVNEETGQKAIFRLVESTRATGITREPGVSVMGSPPTREGDTPGEYVPMAMLVEPDLGDADVKARAGRSGAATDADVQAVSDALTREMRRFGLDPDAITLRVARRVFFGPKSLGRQVSGTYSTGKGIIRVAADLGDRKALLTMRHEIIHALRDGRLWKGGEGFGLFTREEWVALVREARANPTIRAWVKREYPDLSEEGQIEEMVAEYFARWATDQEAKVSGTVLQRALARLRDMMRAIARVFARGGTLTGEQVMWAILTGEVGGRGGPGGGRPLPQTDSARQPVKATPFESGAELRSRIKAATAGAVSDAEIDAAINSEAIKARRVFDMPDGSRAEAVVGRGLRFSQDAATRAQRLTRAAITKAMSGDYNLLALVPGRPLIEEMGRGLASAQSYLRFKNQMETDRNLWIQRTQDRADDWRRLARKNKAANDALMRIMHESTIFETDPTQPFKSHLKRHEAKLIVEHGTNSDAAVSEDHAAAIRAWERDQERKAAHARLSRELSGLPGGFQQTYETIRDEYAAMQAEYDKALDRNITKVAEIAVKRSARRLEKAIREIEEDGSLTADEKQAEIEKAEARHAKNVSTARQGAMKRSAGLRQAFESNRLRGPYFPLARFGDFFITARDSAGHVVRFSRFESEADQMAAAQAEREAGNTVDVGVLSEQNSLRGMVDPKFVVEVEQMLAGVEVPTEIMDAVWQRWLETLPEVSVRKNRIHRKGRAGYSDDAFRAYTSNMFHSSYQLARLRHGLDMQDALDEAELEAARSSDPNRNGLLVREIAKRHEHVMNPVGAPWVSFVTSFTFGWFLGITPAAAIVNLTQTTMLGIPILSSINPGNAKDGMAEAAAEIAKAGRQFMTAKQFHVENHPDLTEDERAAIKAAYAAGVIDKTQAHDLAGMAEDGLRYNPVAAKAMKIVSFTFHHAERLNREVTFMAAYRMSRNAGMDHDAAVEKASEATYRTHFSYQASDRPRAIYGNVSRVIFVFRNYNIQMIWRLFRDIHEATKGESEQVRREARRQLFGITAMMMLHAGVSGVWLFSVTMMIAGLFMGGGADEAEAEFKSAIVELLGPTLGGALWYGPLGQMTGIDLTSRIGMADLWFRDQGRDLEGVDSYNAMVKQMLGASFGIIEGGFRGMQMIEDGNWYRGVETMVPKALRDVMRASRYGYEGATTLKGDPLVDNVDAMDVAKQVLGFTPAQISERYQINNILKNREGKIIDRRQKIMGQAARAIIAGEPIPEKVLAAMDAFNAEFPEYPISARSLKQSVSARIRASDRNEFGIQLNPRLNDRLRAEAPPAVN